MRRRAQHVPSRRGRAPTPSKSERARTREETAGPEKQGFLHHRAARSNRRPRFPTAATHISFVRRGPFARDAVARLYDRLSAGSAERERSAKPQQPLLWHPCRRSKREATSEAFRRRRTDPAARRGIACRRRRREVPAPSEGRVRHLPRGSIRDRELAPGRWSAIPSEHTPVPKRASCSRDLPRSPRPHARAIQRRRPTTTP